LMFLRRNRPATGKGVIQQFNARHAENGKLAPVRQTTAAAFTCSLKCEEVRDSFLNPVVLRLHDPLFIVIGKSQHPFPMDCCQDELVNSRIYVSGGWVPYDVK
jgi:hypothetical protein